MNDTLPNTKIPPVSPVSDGPPIPEEPVKIGFDIETQPEEKPAVQPTPSPDPVSASLPFVNDAPTPLAPPLVAVPPKASFAEDPMMRPPSGPPDSPSVAKPRGMSGSGKKLVAGISALVVLVVALSAGLYALGVPGFGELRGKAAHSGSYCPDDNGCDVGSVYPTCWVNHYYSLDKDDPVVNDIKIAEGVQSASMQRNCGAEQIDVACTDQRCLDGSGHNICYASQRYSTDCTTVLSPTPTPVTLWCGNCDQGTCALRTLDQCNGIGDSNPGDGMCSGTCTPPPTETPTPAPQATPTLGPSPTPTPTVVVLCPKPLVACSTDNQGLALSWNATDGASSYVVRINKDPYSNWFTEPDKYLTASQTSLTVSPLDLRAHYSIHVEPRAADWNVIVGGGDNSICKVPDGVDPNRDDNLSGNPTLNAQRKLNLTVSQGLSCGGTLSPTPTVVAGQCVDVRLQRQEFVRQGSARTMRWVDVPDNDVTSRVHTGDVVRFIARVSKIVTGVNFSVTIGNGQPQMVPGVLLPDTDTTDSIIEYAAEYTIPGVGALSVNALVQ